MNTLGKIQKPDASDYLQGRKAYWVRILQYIPSAPDEYKNLYNQYWDAAEQQLVTIEAKTGTIKHIFCEGLPSKGEDAKVGLERSNPGAFKLIKNYLDSGIKITQFEDNELLFEVLDWAGCMGVGLLSQKVTTEIQTKYQEANTKRQQFQFNTLNDTIKDDEAALILFNSQNLTVPDDLQRFLVSPPELDKVDRWIREATRQFEQQQEQPPQKSPNDSSGADNDGNVSSSGIWTP